MKLLCMGVCLLSLLGACATSQPDHFYVLRALPTQAVAPRTASGTHVILKVTLPSLIDRAEMVLDTTADGVIVLDHERWAAPLPDLVAQTLGRDLERRRGDILVADRSIATASVPAVKITIDIVQAALRKEGRASIEAHWRILDTRAGTDIVGGDVFTTSLVQDGYASVAQALSECLGLLADRLVALLPAQPHP